MAQPQSEERQPITKEYSGKWIAWNEQRTRIVASGETFLDAQRAAQDAGVKQPALQKVPPLEGGFAGGL